MKEDKKQNIKQFILKIGIVFLLLLVVFTFFSKTIHNNMLPKVRVIPPVGGNLTRTLNIYDYRLERMDTATVIAEGNWTVKEVFVKEGDEVVEGTPIFSIDIDRYRAELLRLQSQAVTLDNQLLDESLADEDRRAIELNSYAAWREYRILRDSFPSSGEVVSTYTGMLLEVNVEPYDILTAGQKLMEIITEESTLTLQFELSFAEDSTYSGVEKVKIRREIGSETIYEDYSILKKERNDNGYTIFIKIPEDMGDNGVIQYISLERKSERYEQILPTSCIQTDIEGQFVYVLEEDKNAQAFTAYVRKAYVTVLESNDMYTAIELFRYSVPYDINKIIYYSNKPISYGDEVIVE